MALGQVIIAADQIDAQRIGLQSISLTHFSDALEPAVAAGSLVEVGGALFEAAGDEAIAGLGAIANDNDIFIKLTAAGASVTASATLVAPTWSTSAQGWYIGGTERVIGGLHKDVSGDYRLKWLYSPADNVELPAMGKVRPIRKTILEIGNWDMDATAAVLLTHGVASGNKKIRSVTGIIRDDSGNCKAFPSAPPAAVSGEQQVWVYSITLASLGIARLDGGIFDDANYNTTPYNRGWMMIEYEA